MRIDSAGWPFIAGALLFALIAGWFSLWLSIPFLVLAGFFLFFFRDPERTITEQPDAVLSPADGRVLVAGPAMADAAPPRAGAAEGWQQISVFLSPMDVHVNRVPVSGRVTSVSYKPGRFLPAYHTDAAGSNERSEVWIDHNGRVVVVRQIVGILARRVVCRVQPGATVMAGERYGIMKFGSRMDVFLPPTADILVKVGEVVRGGETIIAVLH